MPSKSPAKPASPKPPEVAAPRRGRLSITRKLLTLVAVSLGVIALLLTIVLVVLKLSNGVRAFVGGEGLWSKGQKDASYFLVRYIRSGAEIDWQNYEENIALPLGDRAARLELERPKYDRAAATDGFLQGGIAPEDIPAMIFLFRNFQNYSEFAKALSLWKAAEVQVEKLVALAEQARANHKNKTMTPAASAELLAELHTINTEVGPLEREFSTVISELARSVQDFSIALLLISALLLTALLVWVYLRIGNNLRTGIVGLRDATAAVARGDFAYRIQRRDNDELGDLANAFNSMIDRRSKAEHDLIVASEMQNKILQSSTNAIYALDREGRFTMANRRTCEMSGFSQEELLGRSFGPFFPDQEAKELQEQYSALIKGSRKVIEYEGPFLRKDGSTIFIVFTTNPIINDHIIVGATGAAEDITERKHNAEQLQAHAAELARSNRELEQFAYVASHDLQEPLRSISSFAQLLGKRYKGQLGEEADEYIGFISDSIKRMRTLLEDLLAFSKVAGGSKELKPISMAIALKSAQDNLKAAIATSDAMITFGDMPTLTADPGQMIQLFQNLLGNAIKFRGKSTPLIHISSERDGDYWKFVVADNGIGVSKDSAERIFVLFQRLHTLDQYTGNGIGLTICKKIVELHHGRIWAEPGAKGGTEFHFTLRA